MGAQCENETAEHTVLGGLMLNAKVEEVRSFPISFMSLIVLNAALKSIHNNPCSCSYSQV